MSTARPFFSIVIPLYNKQEYIADTLYSALHQSFSDFEILVINDGSTDSGAELVGLFSDHRLSLIHQKNAGVSAARNTGIRHAKGHYIAFLDADDLWAPDYLAEMNRLIEKYPACGFYGAAHTVIEKHRQFIEGRTMHEGIIKDYFRNEWFHHITRLSATIVNPVVFEKISGFPEGMVSGEDSYFCASIAREFPVAYTPNPMVIYNKRFTGLSQRFDKTDNCRECWLDLFVENDFYRNELIAGKALKAGIRYALGFNRLKSKKMEHDFRYTRLSRKKWRILFILNRIPALGIKAVIRLIILKKFLLDFYRSNFRKQLLLRRQQTPPPEPTLFRSRPPKPAINL